MIAALQIADGHILEKFCGVLSDSRISSHQGQIGIHGSCLLVIIAGSDLCDILDVIAVPVCDQTDFGMHFVTVESVDHTASCFFQTFRPVDVVLLVKSCTQLDQHGDFFSIFRSCAQVFHQSCLLCQAVDGDLDRHYIRICRGIFDQLQERIHAFVWVEQQDIILFHLF